MPVPGGEISDVVTGLQQFLGQTPNGGNGGPCSVFHGLGFDVRRANTHYHVVHTGKPKELDSVLACYRSAVASGAFSSDSSYDGDGRFSVHGTDAVVCLAGWYLNIEKPAKSREPSVERARVLRETFTEFDPRYWRYRWVGA